MKKEEEKYKYASIQQIQVYSVSLVNLEFQIWFYIAAWVKAVQHELSGELLSCGMDKGAKKESGANMPLGNTRFTCEPSVLTLGWMNTADRVVVQSPD